MTNRTTFQIGSQSAGTINQAGGNQVNTVSQGPVDTGALDAVYDLRAALAVTPLQPGHRQECEELLSDIEDGLQSEHKDPRAIASPLQKLIELLSAAGALAERTERLITPLAQLARGLGHAGGFLLRLLAL